MAQPAVLCYAGGNTTTPLPSGPELMSEQNTSVESNEPAAETLGGDLATVGVAEQPALPTQPDEPAPAPPPGSVFYRLDGTKLRFREFQRNSTMWKAIDRWM